MANTFNTPNMGLVVPVVGVDPGPDWANNINADLSILDSHTHAPGSGIQITPSGININADLPFNINNAINLRSVRLFPNPSPINGALDIGSLYESGVDLYYNDGSGNQIRITQSGSVAGSAGTITGLPSGTASASFSAVSGTFVFQQATSTAANLDVGSIAIRYPGSYPTPAGNYIQLEAPSSLSSGFALTLPTLPAQTNVMTLGSTGTISSITYNDVANDRTRAVGTSVGVGGVAISNTSGTAGTSSLTLVAVTALSVSLQTSGRPVYLSLIDDGTLSNSFVEIASSASNTIIGYYAFFRDSTQLTSVELQIRASGASSVSTSAPPGSVNYIDVVSAGNYTYSVSIAAFTSSQTFIQNCKLIAYEL